MNKSVDPLLLLRDYHSNEKPIQYLSDDHLLVFGSTKIPVDAKTAWIKKVNNTQYTIGALWFFLQKKDLPIRDYMIEADHASFEKIHLLDKNKIIDYFSAKIDTVDDIDKTLIPETLITVGKSNRLPEASNKAEVDRVKATGAAEKREEKAKRKEEEEKGMIKKLIDQNRVEGGDETKERELKVMEYLLKNEKKIVSKNSILQAPGKSFAKIYSLCSEMIGQKEKGDAFLEKIKAKGVKQILNVKISTLKKKQKVSLLDEILHSGEGGAFNEGKPIIIVPAVPMKGNLCMANVHDFLVKGAYRDGEEAEQNLPPEEQLRDKIEFEYSINNKRVKFEVYDSVTAFTKSHWKRVVALFAQGQEWQFKDWPSKESIVDIFLKVRGYYLTFADVAVPPNVQKWNVKVLQVSRTLRHADQSVKKEFWDDLKEFLLKERYKGS